MTIGGAGTPYPAAQPMVDQAVLAAVLAARPAVAQMQSTAAAAVAPPTTPDTAGGLDVYL